MSKLLNTTNILAFIFAFILISISIFCITSIDKENRIALHLQNATNAFSTQYNTVYNSYMKISKTANLIVFDSPEITKTLKESNSTNSKTIDNSRKKLYELLENRYVELTKLGFKQINFYTKDNKCFLHMNNPEDFGNKLDNMSFNIVHGFRFIYPIYDEKNFIGKIEFFISPDAFIKSLENTFGTDIHFILDKEKTLSSLDESYRNLYHESVEDSNYITLEEKNLQNPNTHIPKEILKENLGNEIDKNMKEEKNFSLYLKYNDDFMVSTFLPLKNLEEKEVVGYLVSYTKNEYIKKIYYDFIKINIVLEILSILLLYFIYQLNKNKQQQIEDQKLISENSKLDSMTKMIGNIAHHWRQPLSVISTIASSLKMQHELKVLKDDYFDKSLNTIVKTTRDLSKTIDDFRDYLTAQNEISTFKIDDTLKKVLAISSASIKNDYIHLIKNINCSKEITSTESILVESIIKILNNAVDALQKIENHNNRFIFLNIKDENKKLIISITDSAGGVPEDIIEKIFEPYFTTKHQATGTGLGLYTVRSNVMNILKGDVSVKNSTFEHDSKTFNGATFTITIKI